MDSAVYNFSCKQSLLQGTLLFTISSSFKSPESFAGDSGAK
jgi:hypothetical protein